MPLFSIITALGLFVVGVSIGSFCNAVAWRYLEGGSVHEGRSRCRSCSRELRWWELVPLLSFILLRGSCARCHQEISAQYPIVEFVLGVLVLVVGWSVIPTVLGITVATLLISALGLLVILFVIDLRSLLLPDFFVAGVTFIAVPYALLQPQPVHYLLGAVSGTAALLIIWLVTKGKGIGFGDVKLMIPLGLLLGWPATLIALFVAFIAGGFVGIVLLLTKRASLKTAIPFGPFLIGASGVLLLFPGIGDWLHSLLWWYL